jgi:hypothetical protein
MSNDTNLDTVLKQNAELIKQQAKLIEQLSNQRDEPKTEVQEVCVKPPKNSAQTIGDFLVSLLGYSILLIVVMYVLVVYM